ncbi:hypothetical protein V1517DRAFT_333153 [Lipomyces orientalis]|uniref:Uncharacterized protein n=1 Tax=Lipomyces orientalis TaxID=1233043 RepID=A0ACC3TEQ7_9ASCO
MTPPRRALISITSAHATLFQGKETTGVFISEALPYKVLTAAGFEVDLTSEMGTTVLMAPHGVTLQAVSIK